MTKLRFAANQYRALPNPSGTGKIGVFYAKVSSLSPELRDWRDVNPRDINRKSGVYRAIKETLFEEPGRFAERNRGLTLSASEVDFDEKRREVVLTLEDKSVHGLLDGGHTADACLEAQAERGEDASDWPAEVFVKVMTGLTADQITEIGGGLNTSQQVDLRSLSNLDHHFDKLKGILSSEPYYENIAFKMNEPKDIDVREVLYYLAVFDAVEYNDNKHPSNLFGRKEGIVRKFADQAEAGGGSFDNLVTKAPEILRLRDMIEKRTVQIPEVRRRKESKKNRVGSKSNRSTPLHFLGGTIDGKISLGWIMPMLGAFRANVVWDHPKGSFSWRVPLDELLDSSIENLVAGVLEIHDRENARPEYVGRNATAWRLCFDRVKNAILEKELNTSRRN